MPDCRPFYSATAVSSEWTSESPSPETFCLRRGTIFTSFGYIEDPFGIHAANITAVDHDNALK